MHGMLMNINEGVQVCGTCVYVCRSGDSDVLQRVVWQVRDETAVWLLSNMGPLLGLQEESYTARDTAVTGWHNQLTGTPLHLLLARGQGQGWEWEMIASTPS